MKRSAFKSRGKKALSGATRTSQERPAKTVVDRQASLDAQARKAARRIERLLATAVGSDVKATTWETGFLSSVKERIEKYGRAFGDPEKGNLAAPLSFLQAGKVRQIQASVKMQLARHTNESDR